MGVGEKPEVVDQEAPPSPERAGGKDRNGGNGGRGSARKTARKRADMSDIEVPIEADAPTKDRRASRERSLNRLLAGLRAVNRPSPTADAVADGTSSANA